MTMAVLQVLVIGGGDGGAVRELTRHPAVKEVTMCEIDEVCKTKYDVTQCVVRYRVCWCT